MLSLAELKRYHEALGAFDKALKIKKDTKNKKRYQRGLE